MKKTLFAASIALAALASPALAQDLEPVSFYVPLDANPDPAQGLPGPEFQLGIRTGYLRAKDADEGTWFGGVQARLYLIEQLAIEGSVEFHQSDFEDGDVVTTTYPVQLTALLLPFPDWKLRPYGLAGIGWYYTRVDFKGTLAALEDDTVYVVGIHLGAGGDLRLGSSTSVSADVRYIWLDDTEFDNIDVDGDDISYWQLTAALNFKF
jgi:opacity protein-like surface antigen